MDFLEMFMIVLALAPKRLFCSKIIREFFGFIKKKIVAIQLSTGHLMNVTAAIFENKASNEVTLV